MGLSSAILSVQLNIAQSTVSRWLRQLCDVGLLKWAGNKAVAGTKAKHYEAKHLALIDAIERLGRNAGTSPHMTGSGNVASMFERYGEGHEFRQKVSFWAAHQGMTYEELTEAVLAHTPNYFNQKNTRRRELKTCFNGAKKKVALAG